MAVPSCDEVRLSPPLRRFHQLWPCVLSFISLFHLPLEEGVGAL